MTAPRGFFPTLAALLRDPGVLLLALVAPVLYSFFYPWPYLHQAPTRVPVALVDADHSSLSRQIARYVAASPKLEVLLVTGDEGAARAAMQRGEIEGYAVLPRDLRREVLLGQPVVAPVVGNGAYFLLNKVVLAGFAESLGTVSAGVELRKLRARGASGLQAAANRTPIQLQLVPLYNPTEGYGSYVVPAVAVLIVHQTLLMAIAMWAGTWFEKRSSGPLGPWWPRLAACAALGLASGAWFFQAAFRIFDFGTAAHPAAQVLLLALLAWAAAALGLALGALAADRERAMQLMLFSSIPMVFLSGFSWPAEALAPPLRALAALLPTTPAIQGLLRVNQMDATLADVQPQLAHLALLAAGATALAFAALASRRTPA
ncbi:ABC transporter permease [Ideonella sp. YS5]|uniref:ABC transporter permease n=1 Tax=Ideonella sp. YS5 TaxID=3453714 RepID=UPI003EF07EBC